MKTRMFLTMLVALAAFSSCSKDEDPAPLTKEQAKAEVVTLKANYATEMKAMDNNEGVKVLESFDGLNLPFELPGGEMSRSQINAFYSNVEQVKSSDISSLKRSIGEYDDTFVFKDYVGTWEWNGNTKEFKKTSTTPSDKIVLKFPYPSNSATNNAVYTITKSSFTSESDGGEFAANITLSGSEVYNISLSASGGNSFSSLNYNSKTVYTSLTTPKVSYEHNNSMNISGSDSKLSVKASYSVKKNGEIVLAGDYDVTSSTSNNAATVVMKSTLRIVNIKFVYEVSYSANSGDGSASMNQNIKMGVYKVDGAKIGDIKYESVNGTVVAIFYYTSGEKVPALELFGDVFKAWNDLYGKMLKF
ncbi:hypothetical protein [Williamwhitmania taraxaci]|uniref:Uncharacterized protein n=1 Tax=Williamwhitmania taraxaci TaxID=1640674 RepID=A0A1G6HJL4_9BACT|nr:hypothetical protein [Williamwhitmania taraxaci]SDB94105.1 hypothetical protein SAMN05216323_101139 [Williamwhitmania taraxaci]